MDSNESLFVDKSPLGKFISFCKGLLVGPVVWFRETIVEPNQQQYYWYHRQFRRVPTVDECYTDDLVCIYEANEQYKRDRKVDENIIYILRRRFENCAFEYSSEQSVCQELRDIWQNALTNYFIKYGDLGIKHSCTTCYMKQKHRMAWERRHGPVGSGKKPPKEEMPVKEGTC